MTTFDPEPHRGIHLVGTIPVAGDKGAAASREEVLATDTAAMQWAVAQTLGGTLLHSLPTGETGPRGNWTVPIIEALRANPQFALQHDGAWTDYDDMPRFRPRRGHRLTGDDIDLGYARYVAETYQAFDGVRQDANRPELPLQVSVPGDLDLAAFALGPAGGFRHRGAFRAATVREITAVADSVGNDVVFQIEVPLELVLTAKPPGPLQPLAATMFARGITRIAQESPTGARFGVHLCVGDFRNKALGNLRNVEPLVTLANAIAERWPADRHLEFIHAPLAAGDQPPPREHRWYDALRRLDIPTGTRFAAGFVHEDAPETDQVQTLRRVEELVGRRVDVAAACGLGRRSDPNAATEVMRRSRRLAAQ